MEFQEKKAIYLQIADYVAEQILLNKWLPQQKIPSIREFAVDIAVNANTVIRAYTYLQEQKIIDMRRGIGYFVLDCAVENIKRLKKQIFFQIELPALFKSMHLLNIHFSEIEKIYKEAK
ncbi:MAG: GntR family transcriptional regulator [Gammaproteobacteria bacterium RIFCSPHIGHO2_12_FULL_41_15]|nr:MAG: GntR family transcriptional regulator [Gammaproteobacteria bacterium RIFCSPHIGHO2_12_FULL_41_15]